MRYAGLRSVGIGCRIVVILCAAGLGGCFSSGKSKACYKPQEYQSSIELGKLQIPDDLDTPRREGILLIAEGPRATEPLPDGQPCLNLPPDYFGLDAGPLVAAAGAAAPAASAGAVASQDALLIGLDERAGEWHLSLEGIYLGSEGSSGEGGSSIEVMDDWGLGFLVGYDFTNHLALGFEMNYLKPRYNVTILPDVPNPAPITISEKLTVFNGQLKGTYNILKGPVTPFIDLSLGLTYLDSNVVDQIPVTGCWWDPWWGYICTGYWSTYSDMSFSYGGGLGLRWDVSRDIFLRAGYSMLKIDASSEPTLDMGRLEIGWRY